MKAAALLVNVLTGETSGGDKLGWSTDIIGWDTDQLGWGI